MGLRRRRLAYISAAIALAAMLLPQIYWLWLGTRTFIALDMPVSLSKGDIRTPEFPVNLSGWYHVSLWVDSDFSGCWSDLSYHALVSRSTVYSNGNVIESAEGRDRYLGHFYAARKGYYRVASEMASDPTCFNAGRPRLGVWTDSTSYVNGYDQLRNAGIVVAIICLGLFAFSFFSTGTLFAPAAGRIDAPDDSLPIREVASQSVELLRQRRLPLRRKFAVLPDRGLIGGAMILLLLVPVFVMVTQHDLARGIYVRLVPRHHAGPDENCLEGPIVVAVRQRRDVSQLFLNGTEVSREQLEPALKSKFAGRANWEVFVEGDDSAPFAEPMSVIDVINSLHAKAVILTPELKGEMTRACPAR